MPPDSPLPKAPLPTTPAPITAAESSPRPVLVALRRGVWLVRWGILLTGVALLFGPTLGSLVEASRQQGIEPGPLLEGLNDRWPIWRAVVVIAPELMIVVGAILLSTAPVPSKAAPMAHDILQSCALIAALFAAVCVLGHSLRPAAEAPLGEEWATICFLFVAGKSFAAWGHRIADWFVAIGGDDDRTPNVLRISPSWQRLAGWLSAIARVLSMFTALIWIFIGFFVLGVVALQAIGDDHPFMLAVLLVAGALFAVTFAVGGLVFPLAMFCLFFESGWLQRKLEAAMKEPVIPPLATLPIERVSGTSLFRGLLAIGFLALGLWADRLHFPANPLPADPPSAHPPAPPSAAAEPLSESPTAPTVPPVPVEPVAEPEPAP